MKEKHRAPNITSQSRSSSAVECWAEVAVARLGWILRPLACRAIGECEVAKTTSRIRHTQIQLAAELQNSWLSFTMLINRWSRSSETP